MDTQPTRTQTLEDPRTAALVRKVVRHLMPVLGIMYLIAYIDRQNIGYAKLQMVGDLGMTETAYGRGASLFFIGYLLFELPSNLFLARVGARVWFAEGQARLAAHLPLITVRAVAVLRYTKRRESSGRTFVTHDVDVYMQTDSRAAALVLKLIGPAAPHLAEEGASQLLLFFSGVARHLEAHPDETFTLLKS